MVLNLVLKKMHLLKQLDAIKNDEDEFEVGGKTFKVTGDPKTDEKKQKKESMFDDISDDMLAEELEGTSQKKQKLLWLLEH